MTKHVDDKDLLNISGAGGVDVEPDQLPGTSSNVKPEAGDTPPGDAPDSDANHEGGYTPGQG